MKIEDIPKTKRTPANNKTVITDIDTIESDEGWDNGYKQEEEEKKAAGVGRAKKADTEEPAEVDDQPVHGHDDEGPTEGAETPDERAIQLLSAVETACRDLQAHWFSHEKPEEEARCPTLLHLYLWLFAMEVGGRDAWDLTRWESTPHPNSPNIGDRDQVSRLADLVVPRD
jgi:hypothetical protein